MGESDRAAATNDMGSQIATFHEEGGNLTQQTPEKPVDSEK